ncbi:unnamed protein product [Symbiodinium sp. CCMP2592]|nr:unnamed protein product [Symbiodinium sp. CCMP2592]
MEPHSGLPWWPRDLPARGSLRRLGGDDTETPAVPVCEPGYMDSTQGHAYIRSCASHCPGGRNYATEQCSCACIAGLMESTRDHTVLATTTPSQVDSGERTMRIKISGLLSMLGFLAIVAVFMICVFCPHPAIEGRVAPEALRYADGGAPEAKPRLKEDAFALRVAAVATVPEATATVVPNCRQGYIDVTGGKAFPWTCAFYCEGGQNFATASCLCACLTQEQIDRLGLSLNATTTTPGVASGGEVLVTPPPDTEGIWSDPVEEVPVGELNEGRSEPFAQGGPDHDYLDESASTTTTEPPPPTEPPPYTDWQTILLVLTGTFLIMVAVGMVVAFAHRNGFLGAIQVVKTNKLDTPCHETNETNETNHHPADKRLSPDKLSCLRRDSLLSDTCPMSAKAMVAMDHLDKLRNSGDAAAKHAANYHLDSLKIARTRPDDTGGSDSAQRRPVDMELMMQRRKSDPERPQEPLPPVQRRFSCPDQLQVPSSCQRSSSKTSNVSAPSVVLLADSAQLQMLRTPSKVSVTSSRSLPQRPTEQMVEVSRRPSTASANAPPVSSLAKDRLTSTWRSSQAAAASGGRSPSNRASSRHSQQSASSAQAKQAKLQAPASPSRSRLGSKASQVHPINMLS